MGIMLEAIQSVSPLILIGISVGGVLVLFLLGIYARVAWERNDFGMRKKFGKRRHRHRPAPNYPPLAEEMHDAPVSAPASGAASKKP